MISYSEHLSFRQSTNPITELVSKLGGQPCWLDAPSWPISRKLGKPMTFIGQIRIEGPLFGNPQPFRMAYLFMTDVEDSEESDLQTYDPDAGENAVVIQPGNYQGPTRPLGTGPTVGVNTLSYNTIPDAGLPDYPVRPVWSLDEAMARADEYRSAHPFKPLEPASGSEFAIGTHRVEEHPYISEEELFAEDLSVDRQEEMDKISKSWEGTKFGGSPAWVQHEQFPFNDWLLLFQAADEALPVAVNFGTGVAYCFVNKELTVGKMLWQC
jgi:hypothetical protein